MRAYLAIFVNLQRIFTDRSKVGNLVIHSMYLFYGRLCYSPQYDQSVKMCITPSLASLGLEDMIACKFVFRTFKEPESQIKLPAC